MQGKSHHMQPRERIRRMAGTIDGANARGTLAILRRVSDRREGGLQPSLLDTGRHRDAGLRKSWTQLGGG